MKVAVLNNIPRNLLQAQLGPFEEVALDGNPEIVMVRSEDLKQRELPASLLAIGRAGSGVDNIPLERCSQSGVVVFNAPGANANAVKELVVGSLVAISRHWYAAARYLEQHPYPFGICNEVEEIRKNYRGEELAGKKILILGVGHVGSRVAKACSDLGMEVFGYDPYISWINSGIAPERRILSADLSGTLKIFDFITLHCNLTDETRKMVDGKFLGFVKRGVKLLNFARGEIVDAKALFGAIVNNFVDFYISDFPNYRLFRLVPERVLFLPHIGGSTATAEERAVSMVASQVRRFISDGAIENSVNFPACSLPLETGRARLVVSNVNIPGIISGVTALLGGAGFNVAAMLNASRGEVGYNLIDIDNSCRPAGGHPKKLAEVIDRIQHLKGVTKIRLLATKKP